MGPILRGFIFFLTGESFYASTTAKPLQSGKTVQSKRVQDKADQHRAARISRRLSAVTRLDKGAAAIAAAVLLVFLTGFVAGLWAASIH